MYADLYKEALDEGAQEDTATAKLEDEENVINISSDVKSHEDEEGPLAEFDDNISHKEPWIWRLKD